MRFQGTVYRAHDPKWAFLPDSGDGAALHGGRFNPKGVSALYTATGVETAYREAQQGLPNKPVTLCSYEVDCEDIADLTNPNIRLTLGISESDLSCAWEYELILGKIPPSWIVSDNLRASGFSGVLVPSYLSGSSASDVNLVFWNWGANPPHRVRIIDVCKRLPKNQDSWK
jgi:RES domain-containing protein